MGDQDQYNQSCIQVVVERKKLEEFEMARVGRFSIMGSCVVAPCIRSWYLVLEKIVKFQGFNLNILDNN